jgi:hypothetical protein
LMPNGLFCKNLVSPEKSAAKPKFLGRFLTSFRLPNIGALIPRPIKPRQGPEFARCIGVLGRLGQNAEVAPWPRQWKYLGAG